MPNLRYTSEEFARRGQEIFDRKIAAVVQGEDPYKYVAIDIESEDFEVDKDQLAAADRLFQKNPEAQLWFRRVGFPVAEWIGGMGKRNGSKLRRKGN
jgi:hypothetical protein